MSARRLTLAALVSLGVSAAGTLLTSTPALAAAPSVEESSVSDVAATSATLLASVSPGGAVTSYVFEYTQAGGVFTPVPAPGAQGSLPEGTAGVTLSVHVQNLTAATAYQFRIVATNSAETVTSETVSFTTESAGAEFVLPDGRQWELVSPPNKYGALIDPFVDGTIEASEDGSAFTYLANAPTEPSPEGNSAPTPNRILARRGATGAWLSKDITIQHSSPVLPTLWPEYRFFSADLSLSALQPTDEEPLAPGASGPTMYVRDSLSGAFQTVAKSVSNAAGGSTVFQGASPDLRHIVYKDQENGELYEWSAGHAELVSVLPEGAPPIGQPGNKLFVGNTDEGENSRHAVSTDGSRVIFSVYPLEEGRDIYLRDMAKGETVWVNAGVRYARFQIASADGERVFFTGGSQGPEKDEVGELYEYDAEHGKLTDLTPGAKVLGDVPGASEDGSYVYFVSDGVLAPGATAGNCSESSFSVPSGNETCSLYVAHDDGTGWKTTFIATLSGGDYHSWGGYELVQQEYLENLTSRVSSDGRYLAFMSERSLTGYDNRDVNSGVPDEEVYLYDASSGHLVCASCDPTGARPTGLLVNDPRGLEGGGPLVDRGDYWQGRWLAGSVPGYRAWNNLVADRQQPRYLSDSGRLFFDSSDALVPQDTNGREDVYEYEPAGKGSCVGENGCVALISSGSSGEESAFLDASANGDDVFFLTSAQLMPQDFDTAFDVYDARVCTSQAPCASVPVSPPACSTADSCKPAPSPQPAIFGAPSSATFSGASNPSPATTVASRKATKKTVRCAKGRKREHGKCVMKAKVKGKRAKARRSNNDRRAGR